MVNRRVSVEPCHAWLVPSDGLHALRSWLDTWAGIGHVAVGMHRQGYDLQLTQDDDRDWRATFYTTQVLWRATHIEPEAVCTLGIVGE